MPYCEVPGANLFYTEKGQGEPLIFLNGLSSDHSYWLAHLRVFAKSHRCFALDNRDGGRCTSAPVSYTLRELALDVLAFMDRLEITAAHIAGTSMGGMVAQEIALAAPARVKSLTLMCTLDAADDWFCGTLRAFELIRRQVADTPAFFEAILPWWMGHRFFEDSDRPAWLRFLLRQNPYPQSLDGFLRQLHAIAQHDTRGRLGAIRCPTLIVACRDDCIIPVRYSQRLYQQIPHAQFRVLEGVGHAPSLEDARQLNHALAEFLASC